MSGNNNNNSNASNYPRTPPPPPPPSQSQESTATSGERRHHHHQQTPIAIHQNTGIPFGHVPAYLPGSASLIEELDQKVLIVLRDGKHLVGTLSSYDQYSNLVLQNAFERRILPVVAEGSEGADNAKTSYFYADVPLGIYIVRGDSIVLMGQVFHPGVPGMMQEVSIEELEELQEKAKEALQWDFDADLIA